jgi:hypothetical protein
MLTSLVLASALTLAADNSKMRSIEAQVHIDKSGKVQQLDWLHPEQVSDAIGAFLEPAVLAVEFEPAQKNGEATDTKLWLNVIVETVERADGGSDLRFVTVEKAWPRIVHTTAARYPGQMLMSGTSAYVMLSVEIDADGRPIEESIALAGDTSPKDSAKVRQFFSSAKKAFKQSAF